MAYETIIYEKKDKMAYITLNRPSVMNAMDHKMGQELSQVWDDFNSWRQPRKWPGKS